MRQEIERTGFKLRVDPPHFEYLVQQKGRLSEFSNRPQLWHRMYVDSLFRDYQSLKKFLPDERLFTVLDVGSGLGGIDVLLNKAYANGSEHGIRFDLLDGENDKPEMVLHRQTFNSMAVAKDFLAKNGVHNVGTFNPNQVRNREAKPQHQYDLVISLGSWCFHYPPDTYLDFVCESSDAETLIVTDVRADRDDYMATLRERFMMLGVAFSTQKFRRVAFALK